MMEDPPVTPKKSEGGHKGPIKQDLETRTVTPHEGLWCLYSNSLIEITPSVQQLAVHTENNQYIRFNAMRGESGLENVSTETTLTAWFRYNLSNPENRDQLHLEFPKTHWFDSVGKVWRVRIRNKLSIRR